MAKKAKTPADEASQGIPGSPKRELLLTTAEGLLRQYGIRRVRVEEICRRAGIGKATFYKHFPNRDTIALAVLDRITIRMRSRYEQELFGPKPFGERLQRMMSLKREGMDELGPALITDLVEDPPPEILNWVQREQAKSYEMGMRFLRDGQAAGAINPAFSPEYLLYLLDVAAGMFNDSRFKSLYPDMTTRGTMLNQFLLFGLSAPPDPALPAAKPRRQAGSTAAEAGHGR